MAFNYKNHWLVKVEENGMECFFMLEELARKIRIFQKESDTNSLVMKEKQELIFFQPSGLTFPDMNDSRKFKDRDSFFRLLSSVPRITGFFPYKGGFLIGWQLPPQEKDQETQRFFYRLNTKGGLIGDIHRNNNEELLGTFEEKIYLLEKKDGELHLFWITM